jgi:hypothetical protein
MTHRALLGSSCEAAIGTLGGLIGIGGIEFRLPVLVALLGMGPRAAMPMNLVKRRRQRGRGSPAKAATTHRNRPSSMIRYAAKFSMTSRYGSAIKSAQSCGLDPFARQRGPAMTDGSRTLSGPDATRA